MHNSGVHRSGYVAIVGRPNVGKSTLLNRILGQKLSIVSHRPQTTRNRVMGLYNRDDLQLVFLDTPGIHEPRSLINKRMVETAFEALNEVDVVLLLVDGPRDRTPERDAGLLEQVGRAGVPVVLVVNKIDQLERDALLPLIAAWSGAAEFSAIIPVSALKGEGVERLLDALAGHMPEGPAYFPKDQFTDVSERFVVSEMIREKVFHQLQQELPYATAVEVEEFDESDPAIARIMARIWVERDSQKGIVIGKGGEALKRIGTAARHDIERLLGTKVFLKLTVGVKEGWTRKRSDVERFGQFRKDS